ncbi:MAG: RNA polymerase factor sigma-54, partial [Bacteroidaceae bacterium]|nr:RNA polymerase factor sigma-54 [Bacteroidaceae bacterium]
MAGNTFAQTQKHEQILTQTLSPQQLLTVQLLELTTMEIEDRVRSEVMDNPALEVVENDDMPENISEGDAVSDFQQDSDDDYSGNGEIPVFSGYSHGDDYVISDSVSFGDTLLEQLAELQLTPEKKTVGEYIIGSLDEDGFLRKDISEIEDELLIYGNVMTDKEQILDVLGRVQAFEPAGIAARNLQECLMLQLNRADSGTDVSLHKRIVGDFYDDFTAKHWEQIADKLGVSKEDCRSAIADIVRLNPRPGASLSENVGFSRQQIIPDFVLDVVDDNVYVSLNNVHVPELRVSDEYVQMLDEQLAGGNQEQKAAATFLKQKIDSAKGFISAVKQRENTMLSTMRAIVAKQKDYFINGGDEAYLKPMILEDIAKMTGYDISTISRVSNSKYVQTPWSVSSLKYFFSDGVTKSDGTEQSVYELFAVIRELIESEDKNAPLTDQVLQEKLTERGYCVARRTVAKYREQLHIPVARL